MGTAHVSGLAALIKGKWPTFDNFDIRSRIRATATDLGSGGPDDYFGHGLVNAANALGPYASMGGFFDLEDNQTCSWESQAAGGYYPLELKWYVDGVYKGSGTTSWWNVGSSSFWLALQATDQQGAISTQSVLVNVSGTGYACPE